MTVTDSGGSVEQVRSEDIQLLAVPGTPALRGELLLVGVTNPDLDTNNYRGGLRQVRLDGSGVRQWTTAYRDTTPVISPDGEWVAFLRSTAESGPGARNQIWLLPTAGGEGRVLTDLPLGAGAPVWAPDSRRIAFTARVPEPGRYGTPADGPDGATTDPDTEAPRRITRLSYRVDSLGYLTDRPAQLYVLDALADDPGPLEPLTDGPGDLGDPVWTPDGRHVVVVADRDFGAVETLNTDLYAIPVDGGDPILVAHTEGSASLPSITDDGTLVYLGTRFEGIHAIARNTGVYAVRLTLDGAPAAPHRLTDDETVDCESVTSSGVPVPYGDSVLVAVRNRGAVELRRVPLSARGATLAELPLLAGAQAHVRSYAVDGDRIVAVVSTWDSPGEVVLLDADGTVPLTDFAAPLREAGLRPMIEVKASAPDGYPTHGWLVLPDGDGPHPLLLNVHGGPFMYYGWGMFDEAQVYAAAGYAVLLSNPRGSAGYGERHGRALLGAFGTVDVDDVLAQLDTALERPDLDASRVGVMGGSYGGWMSSWLAAHHGERFTAVWSERGLYSFESFVGSSDIGWWFADAYCGADSTEHRRKSPLSYADKIKIPVAVVHSEQDWRCPVEQAQLMYVALRRAGAEAELLLFPGEGHELTRSGRPRHRRQRFDAVLEWWSRHL